MKSRWIPAERLFSRFLNAAVYDVADADVSCAEVS